MQGSPFVYTSLKFISVIVVNFNESKSTEGCHMNLKTERMYSSCQFLPQNCPESRENAKTKVYADCRDLG